MSNLKNDKKCIISFVGDITPQEKFEMLKKAIVNATKEIDENTPWKNTEPKWWLDMMKIQEYCKQIFTIK